MAAARNGNGNGVWKVIASTLLGVLLTVLATLGFANWTFARKADLVRIEGVVETNRKQIRDIDVVLARIQGDLSYLVEAERRRERMQ